MRVLLGFSLIYPGQHPFIQGIIMLFMAFVALLSLTWLALWYRWGRESRVLGVIVIAIALAVFSWIAVTYWNYQEASDLRASRVPGRYVAIDGSKRYLIMLDNNTWESDHSGLPCSRGTWTYDISEDGDFINMYCDALWGHMQVWYHPYTPLAVRDATKTDAIEFEKLNDKEP